MAMPRKSDELHDLNGTGTQAAPETAVSGSRPRCPKTLSPEARKIFRTVARELEKRRALTSADGVILELFAVTVEKWRRALEHIREEGEIREYVRLDNHGEQVKTFAKNMWLPIATEAESKITSLLDRLGFTPLARPRIRPTKESAEQGGIKFL